MSQPEIAGLEPTMKCEFCGAVLEGKVSRSGLVTCGYCGTGYTMSHVQTGQRQPLIAAADFSGSAITGWQCGETLKACRVQPGEPIWSITQVNQDQRNHPLLIAPGVYDDFDVSVSFRVLDTQTPRDSLFLRARGAPAGAMILHQWAGGQVTLGWQSPEHQWQDNIVTSPDVPDYKPEAWRRLRWIAVGPRHRAYLDDRLVLSASHPSILQSGHLDLRLQSLGQSVTIEIRELTLREPPGP